MTKRLPCRFKQSFGHFNMLTVHKCPDTGLFQYLSNPDICSLEFKKKITSEAHFVFQSIANFMYIPEMLQKAGKTFLDFEIIAFESGALDTRFF